jgi:hypothetical protein
MSKHSACNILYTIRIASLMSTFRLDHFRIQSAMKQTIPIIANYSSVYSTSSATATAS